MQSIQAGLNRADIDTTEIETLISESGDEKHQLVIFAITYSARRTLPYGRWTTHEGHEVLFNREYQPIAWRMADGTLAHAVRDEIIEDIVKEEFFYNDGNNPADYLTRKVSSRVLTEEEKKACQKSLLICLALLREYAPKRTVSESPSWSLVK